MREATVTFAGSQDVVSFSYCILVNLSELGSISFMGDHKGMTFHSHLTLCRWIQKVKIFSIVHFHRDCRSLGQEDPLEEEMATRSSIPAWKIPWTEKPGGLQSMGLPRAGHSWVTHIAMKADRVLNLYGGLQDKTSFSLCQSLTAIFPVTCAFCFI